ncbi:MAG TPA: hypothetical protein VNO30_49440 [Kofleriaceae bacterium]|nr:hypothetical protein [Kofleriaceae bacterium]
MGEEGLAAGFVGDEPAASLGSLDGGALGLAAGVFFIFTTCVGAEVSGRSFDAI